MLDCPAAHVRLHDAGHPALASEEKVSPMDLLSGLTDDQIALIGCAGLLVVSGTLMSLSYHLGRFLRRQVKRHASRVLPSSARPAAGNDRPRDKAA